jgi:hypothetical protein
MDGDRDRVDEVLRRVTARWVEDPESDVVWAGDHEGRHGVRMRQQVRDFTTVWFDVGQRTLGCEAFLLPDPPSNREAVYRQCLARNAASGRVHVALDRHGDLVIRGREGLEAVDEATLEEMLGAVYELVEIAFPPLVRTGFGREKSS